MMCATISQLRDVVVDSVITNLNTLTEEFEHMVMVNCFQAPPSRPSTMLFMFHWFGGISPARTPRGSLQITLRTRRRSRGDNFFVNIMIGRSWRGFSWMPAFSRLRASTIQNKP